MADDKKEYKKLVAILDATASDLTTCNALSKLALEAEDPVIKKGSRWLADHIRDNLSTKGTGKDRVITLAQRMFASTSPLSKRLAADIMKLWDYSQLQIASATPQWQVIALAAGWTPPKQASKP